MFKNFHPKKQSTSIMQKSELSSTLFQILSGDVFELHTDDGVITCPIAQWQRQNYVFMKSHLVFLCLD